MADSPPEVVATPDLNSLSREQLHDLRLELSHNILNPTREELTPAQIQHYKDTIERIKQMITRNPEQLGTD